MEDFASSHTIIKALKGPEDPPFAGAPSKIEIARKAWESTNTHFPNKDEVLTEWILSSFIRFSKDSGGLSAKGLVLSAPHWILLNDILVHPSRSERESRVWLSSLLGRISILNIVTTFFKHSRHIEQGREEGFIRSLTNCVTILWPLAAACMNLDALTDCLGSILEYIAYDSTQLSSLSSICLSATRSFKQAVGNTTGKKKAFSWFMEHSLLHWVHLVCLERSLPHAPSREAKLFISEVYQAGVDVLFCLDSLKDSNDPLEKILTDTNYPLSNMQSSHYQIVPMLYKSYVQELRKHRYAVFGHGSSQTQEQTMQNKLRDAGMKAFGLCYKALRERGEILEVWKSILVLIEVLEEANLVGYGLSENMDVLCEISGSAIAVCTEPKDDRIERSEVALKILCALSRIDIDLLNPFLPNILSGLLTMNLLIYPSTRALLHRVLDFHCKTRTMPSYLMLLLRTFSGGDITSRNTDASLAHHSYMSSVLLSLTHLEDLSRCIRGFLTPGQTQEVVDSTLNLLQRAWFDYLEMVSVGKDTMDIDEKADISAQAHRTSNSSDVRIPLTIERAALRYSLIARAVAAVLPALPFSSLSKPTCMSIQDSIAKTWTTTLTGAIHTALISSDSPERLWASQSVSAATLRIRHALLTCSASWNHDMSILTIISSKEITALANSPLTIPELVIELFRAFFDIDFQSLDSPECGATINALISYLKTNLDVRNVPGRNSSPSLESLWDGSTSSLSLLEHDRHRRGALVVWYLLLDKWIPILDEIASQEHLKAVSEIVLLGIGSYVDMHEHSGHLSFTWALERALNSAAFWELPNIRDAIMSEMDSNVEHAEWEKFSTLLGKVHHATTARMSSIPSSLTWTTEQVQSVFATFVLLLRTPREYFPRNFRVTLLRRATVADLSVSLLERKSSGESVHICRKTRTVIRVWLVSNFDTFDIMDIIADRLRVYVEYLMQPEDGLDDDKDAFNTVTLHLLSGIFKRAVRSAMNDKPDSLEVLCSLFREPLSSLSEQSRLRFIETVVAECPAVDKLSQRCVTSVTELYSNSYARCSDAVSKMLSSTLEITKEHALMTRSWRTCLTLRNWLKMPDITSTFGAQLIRKTMTMESGLPSHAGHVFAYCTEVFLLLLEELGSVSFEKRKQHFELILSVYILLHGRLRLADRSTCDTALGQIFKSISLDEFIRVLSVLREALEKGLASDNEMRTALHLSSVILDNAPEGTMKIVQEHFENCLHIFCDEPKFVTGDSELSLETITFIGKVCSEKPAYLRHLTLGPIWLLLAKLLMGSTTHTQESHKDILHSITSIASSLIRLRRDLVKSTLPHLGMVTSLLIRSLRAPRAQLGARQRAQVSDTLPWWVSPLAPLGLSEARAVARLLTALQAKTIPRTFTSRSKDKKKEKTAESLLTAFSKHAGPILGAYIGALVDPLVVIDANVREALAPGLYALCDAMGERGRDVLMASGCDAAGRTVLRALWKDYDKQRYVGKG